MAGGFFIGCALGFGDGAKSLKDLRRSVLAGGVLSSAASSMAYLYGKSKITSRMLNELHEIDDTPIIDDERVPLSSQWYQDKFQRIGIINATIAAIDRKNQADMMKKFYTASIAGEALPNAPYSKALAAKRSEFVRRALWNTTPISHAKFSDLVNFIAPRAHEIERE